MDKWVWRRDIPVSYAFDTLEFCSSEFFSQKCGAQVGAYSANLLFQKYIRPMTVYLWVMPIFQGFPLVDLPDFSPLHHRSCSKFVRLFAFLWTGKAKTSSLNAELFIRIKIKGNGVHTFVMLISGPTHRPRHHEYAALAPLLLLGVGGRDRGWGLFPCVVSFSLLVGLKTQAHRVSPSKHYVCMASEDFPLPRI